MKKLYQGTPLKLNRNYFYFKSFEIATRVFAFGVSFPLLVNIIALMKESSPTNWHNCISLFFYAFLLYFLASRINLMTKLGYDDKQVIKALNIAKWILLVLSLILQICSILACNFPETKPAGDAAAYFMTHTFPSIINPNIGFFVITFLVFYLAKVLKVSKNLKEEQELTI